MDVLGKNVYVYHTKHDGKLEYKVRNCIIYQQEDSVAIRDKLLDIGKLLSCYSFTLFLSEQKDFQAYLEDCSPSVVETLDHCFEDTESTMQITSLMCPADTQTIIF